MSARIAEKEELLTSTDEVLSRNSVSIDMATLFITVTIIIASMVLILPKIYFANSIYVESVQLRILRDKYYSLREENQILINRIEQIKFKNRVTH